MKEKMPWDLATMLTLIALVVLIAGAPIAIGFLARILVRGFHIGWMLAS